MYKKSLSINMAHVLNHIIRFKKCLSPCSILLQIWIKCIQFPLKWVNHPDFEEDYSINIKHTIMSL